MNGIILAIVIFIVLGAIAAVILWFADRFFNVPTDEKVAAIRECLPGVNCGACGFTGCDDYANNLSLGGISCSRCTPGGADVAKKLAAVLGMEAEEVDKQVAYVCCCGTEDAAGGLMEYDGIQTCMANNMFYSGKGKCDFACLGFGDCVKKCPFGAISVCNGRAHVDRDICTGCGICTDTCPNGLIHIIPQKARVAVTCSSPRHGAITRKDCSNGCIGCGKCQKACSVGAIGIDSFLASIDYNKCIGCGECIEVCPVGCIHEVE